MTAIWRTAAILALAGLLASPAWADEDKKAGLYSVTVTGTLEVGKAGDIEVKVAPTQGYKWNTEYPAKCQLEGAAGLALGQDKFKKGDFKNVEKSGVLTFKATGRTAGETTINAVMSFSMCNADTCHVLRKRKIPLKVTIK